MKKLMLACAAIRATFGGFAAEKVSLDGVWDFAFRKGGAIEEAAAGFVATDKMTVPGCFDVMPRYYNLRGLAQYRKSIRLDAAASHAFLRVKGMGLVAKFFVDGREVAFSPYAWSTLEIPLGALAAGRHEIVAALDNRITARPEDLFQPHYDFYGSGGFYHGIDLVTYERATEISRVYVRTVDYRTGKVELELGFVGEAPKGKELKARVAFDEGEAQEILFKDAKAVASVPNFRPWSPEAPNLHRVKVAAEGLGEKSERFGIREVRTDGKKILLNGKELYLLGVNRHESHPEFGYATGKPLMMEDVQIIKDLGCNYVRGSHYPQTEDFLDLCDEPDPVDNETLVKACVDATTANVTTLRKDFGDKPIIVAEMGTCGIYGHHDRGGAQWTEEFEAEWLDAAINAVFANKEVVGFTIWQYADARSYFRGGSYIRGKPFAMNLAGVVDGYRREKLAAGAVRKLFKAKAAERK